MKIPKYIDTLLKQRTRYAVLLDITAHELDKWLDKNSIKCESCDTHAGVEIYCNPNSSGKRIREAILNHEKD